ncbi:MAG: hypothetical protein NW226_26765 [Microscillaceae bacterium]|nr:hypothetical protein [Microscillaceae bacterium]
MSTKLLTQNIIDDWSGTPLFKSEFIIDPIKKDFTIKITTDIDKFAKDAPIELDWFMVEEGDCDIIVTSEQSNSCKILKVSGTFPIPEKIITIKLNPEFKVLYDEISYYPLGNDKVTKVFLTKWQKQEITFPQVITSNETLFEVKYNYNTSASLFNIEVFPHDLLKNLLNKSEILHLFRVISDYSVESSGKETEIVTNNKKTAKKQIPDSESIGDNKTPSVDNDNEEPVFSLTNIPLPAYQTKPTIIQVIKDKVLALPDIIPNFRNQLLNWRGQVIPFPQTSQGTQLQAGASEGILKEFQEFNKKTKKIGEPSEAYKKNYESLSKTYKGI